MSIRPTTLVNQMLDAICNDLGISMEYARNTCYAKTLNKLQNAEYMGEQPSAEASLVFETGSEIMIMLSLNPEWIEYARSNGFYIEPYASWKLDVFKLPN